jgi:VWFA-related protein
MTRLAAASLVLLASVTAIVTGQTPAEPRARVLVDAVAFDGRGLPVTDLKQEDVEVWIGHFRVPIESFTSVTPASDERPGRLVVLLLDDVTVPPQITPRVREAARRFVTRMSPGDRMSIVMLDGATMETTDDSARLLKAIDGYHVRGSGVDRVDVLGRHVLKTVSALARQMGEAPDQRKTIAAIGSGWLLDRPIPPPGVAGELLPEWIDAMRLLSLSNVNYYVIDPSGVGMSRVDGGDNGFARETGGRAFLSTNDPKAAVDRVMREAAGYYLIRVGSPPVGAHGLRELEVRSLRRGVTIRARRAVH